MSLRSLALIIPVAGLVSLLALQPVARAEERPAEPAKYLRIDFEATIHASLDRVWSAWTTSNGMTAALGPKTKIELRVGGPYEIYFHPDAPAGERGSEGCRVLSYLPREMLAFSWNAPVKFKHARQHATWVVVRFEEVDAGVRVRLSHVGWSETHGARKELT